MIEAGGNKLAIIWQTRWCQVYYNCAQCSSHCAAAAVIQKPPCDGSDSQETTQSHMAKSRWVWSETVEYQSFIWVKFAFSTLSLLVGRQEERPTCTKWVMRLSVQSEVQLICIWSSWCHWRPIISCFIKIQIGLTFLVPAYPGCLGKEAIKWMSFVCMKTTTRQENWHHWIVDTEVLKTSRPWRYREFLTGDLV